MAIWRGVGGSGESTNDSTVPTVTALLVDAEAARDAAQLAETNAETAASNAASSASTASTQASNAATSATNAASSASAASTSATNAASSASTASTQASNAASSASAASTSASNAASSASSAASSASTATTKASEASTSATNAASSASTATTQASNAASSASAASTSASNASTSASNAASSASSAAASAAAAAASFDAFDDIYLGAKSANPTVDNDGDPLSVGDQYFNTVANELRVYNGSTWQAASTVGGTVTSLTVTGATTLNQNPTYSGGTANGVLYLNGSKVATSGSALTFDGATLYTSAAVRSAGGFVFEGAAVGSATGPTLNGGYSTGSTSAFLQGYNFTSSAFIPLTVTGSYIAFGASSEGMRLTSTGLGIGTSSPGGKLEVYAGASGATAFSNGANFIVQSGTAVGMSLLSPDANACRIYFGTASNNRNAFIYSDYNSGSQTLIFGVGSSTTAATEKMRLDSSGNLGLGVTPSAWRSVYKALQTNGGSFYGFTSNDRLGMVQNGYVDATSTSWTYVTTAAASRYDQIGGVHAWHNAPSGTAGNAITFTQAMTLDASGNLSVGTTSTPSVDYRAYFLKDVATDPVSVAVRNTNSTGATRLVLGNNSGIARFTIGYSGSASSGYIGGASAAWLGTEAGEPLVFQTNGTERARIDSSGNLLVGNTNGTRRLTVESTANTGAEVAQFKNSAATATNQFGAEFILTGDPNNNTNYFLLCTGNATTRILLRSNGGIANYQANDVNLSDRREKTNFAPAGEYLSKICAIPVQTFNYIDQAQDDPGLTLGVVAQDVQAVAPELVMESNWAGKDEEPKMRLSIYQTDLQYALMKCIQELNAKVQALEAQLNKGA